MKLDDYNKFLKTKKKKHIMSGFEISNSKLNENLFDFQKFIVKRALKAGKYAVFADCGLGKTIMQLSWANQVLKKTCRSVLILAPLAVSNQTIEEGAKFDIHVEKLVIGGNDKQGIYITNYEQLANIDCSLFDGVVLDESSILKNYSGKIKQSIIDKFVKTPYKLACTATPAPNDPIELGNHAEFLDVIKSKEMLSYYFVNDMKMKGTTSKWRLKRHAVGEFYKFVGQWSIMLNNPSDIGFDMKGFDLPELNFIEKQVVTEKRDNGLLFNDTAISATNFNKELKLTINERLNITADIVNNSDETFIIWIKQNAEGELLKKLIPDAIEVKGSDKPEFKESKLIGFAHGEFRVLITKYKIAQFGLNYQNCHNQIVASLDFSFEGLYQAIRRSYRFGQDHAVNIYLITTDTMVNVKESIDEKQRKFKIMQDEMSKNINENLYDRNKINMNYKEKIKKEKYELIHGDSFKEIKKIKTESIDGYFFSPPFESLYTYSDNVNDLSNCTDTDEFYKHFDFMIPEIYRTVKSGRMVGMHLTQLTTGIARDGYYSIRDFRGDIIRVFEKHGFIFHGEVSIWKSPELAAVRTKNHQLLHKSTKRDSCIVRPGLADYLVIMRKPGENIEPVTHDGAGVPFDKWCQIASPIWMDIEPSDTLHFRSARELRDEKHLTPTQIQPTERFIELYTNIGDTVCDPFSGIGTTVHTAVKNNRIGKGIELKESYFNQSIKNLELLVQEKQQSTLF